VVALHPVTGALRSGQLPADPGFEHWLLKFDGVGLDHELGTGGHYGRIEYAYHLMACSAGIDMPDCRLLEENGRAHFMIQRFDRDAASGQPHAPRRSGAWCSTWWRPTATITPRTTLS
jgi:serine/threonine-protein kinase HipA